MTKMKLLGGVLLVLAVLFAQVGSAAAAPQTQTGTITGTIDTISVETDANGVATAVVVTLQDGQTLRISVQTAVNLQLVTLDPNTQQPVVDETKFGTGVTINQTDVLPAEEPDVHPISALLGDFFGVDPVMIDSWHNGDFTWTNTDGTTQSQVFGFGVIAQALWMATKVDGETKTTDATLAGQILQAKKTGDYSIVAPLLGFTGDNIPTNWGQFKKAFKDKHENLGAAVSSEKSDKQGKGQNKDKSNKGQGKGHSNP